MDRRDHQYERDSERQRHLVAAHRIQLGCGRGGVDDRPGRRRLLRGHVGLRLDVQRLREHRHGADAAHLPQRQRQPDDNVPGFHDRSVAAADDLRRRRGRAGPHSDDQLLRPRLQVRTEHEALLGVDRRLPGMVGTIDLLYTKSKNTLYIQDNNLDGRGGREHAHLRDRRGQLARYGVNAAATGSATSAEADRRVRERPRAPQQVGRPRLQRHHPAAEAVRTASSSTAGTPTATRRT